MALMAISPTEPFEDAKTENGCYIRRNTHRSGMLEMHYAMYSRQCFSGSLPFVSVYWAETITFPDESHPNAIYVPGDSLVKHPLIAINEALCGMFPLERLCLLHEMVHVKIGPESGHGEEFITEFKRLLDANRWEVMGCIDMPEPSQPTALP